jgi:hypothetical protein
MTRSQLIDAVAKSIAQMEGFFITEAEAKQRKLRWPTRAQVNANPGNIRQWRDANGRPYPRTNGYVDFVAWASNQFPGANLDEISKRAVEEGWRVLRVLVGQYIDGRYTDNQPPTIAEMFRRYAPAEDANNPEKYAEFVANCLGVPPTTRLIDLVTG